MKRCLLLISLIGGLAIPTAASAEDGCTSGSQACGWALLDENNNVTTVIVCTFDVCGSGTFDGKRAVLQTKPSTDGNVAGYNRGTYDEPSNTFVLDDGRTLTGGAGVNEVVNPTPPTTAVPEESTTTVPTVVEEADAQSGLDEFLSNATVAPRPKVVASTKQVPSKKTRKAVQKTARAGR